MIECSLSGRGQGHVSNFYIVDLENFATASCHIQVIYTTRPLLCVGLFMIPETMGADSVASWLSADCLSRLRLNLQLHTIDLVRTCRSPVPSAIAELLVNCR